jgi:hypothetical protein
MSELLELKLESLLRCLSRLNLEARCKGGEHPDHSDRGLEKKTPFEQLKSDSKLF